MEDDDEFGDLYTDVLLQFQPSPSLPPSPKPSIDTILPSHDHENDDVLFPLAPPPNPNPKPNPNPSPNPNPNPNLNFSLSLPPDTNRNSNQDPARDDEVLADGVGTEPRVLEGVGKDSEKNEGLVDEEENFERFDIEEAEEIPGVSNRRGEGNNDWESESDDDDDLNIVLNESNHGGVVVEGFGDGEDDGDDDDDDDPLVIVADSDPGHVPREEREWGEDAGERKEVGEGAKGNGGGTVVCAPKIGFNRSFTYQPYHSQFKVSYVVQSGVIQV